LWWRWRCSSWWWWCWWLNAVEERERGSASSRNQVREVGFLAVFGPKFLHLWSMKITSIYRWWKRDTLSLVVPNFGL
jgi:hypothetical protein